MVALSSLQYSEIGRYRFLGRSRNRFQMPSEMRCGHMFVEETRIVYTSRRCICSRKRFDSQ